MSRTPADDAATRGRTLRRLSVLVIVVIAVASGLGSGWLARGWRIAAAPSPAPQTVPVTVPVREGALDAGLLVQADFTYPAVGTIAGQGIVTQAPAVGATIKEGQVVFEFDLMPQVVLIGERPMVRPLQRGTVGADAAQLNAALARLGQPVSATSKEVTASTMAAWNRLFGSTLAVSGTALPITQISINQLAFVPSLPARVSEVSVPVGTTAAGAVASLSTTTPHVFVTIAADAATQIPPNPTVEVISPIDQSRTPMKVTGRSVRDDGAVVLSLHGELPQSWQGSPLRARISSATQDEPGLLVPRAALNLVKDGSAQVRVLADSTTTMVTVNVVAIDRVDARVVGDLRAGDLVVIAG